jgi:DNA processing protein
MKTTQQQLEEIAFTLIPLVGPILGRQLIAYCGSVEGVFAETKHRIKMIPGIGEEIASQILNTRPLFIAAEEELKRTQQHDVRFIFYSDNDFPSRLLHIPDAPLGLYAKGNVQLNAERCVAIIGTRKPTVYGKACTEEIIQSLTTYDIMVVSGLAYGIDIHAHRMCVELNIPTIGVMGSGMGNIYPDSHVSVAKQMMETGGLVTEFTFDTGPDAVNFPMRNRIVAGMCDVLIVIESGIKGGSMITAALANDYNKDVAAIPGRKMDKASMGCNHLIKRQQAHLVESGDDIIELMAWNKKTRQQSFQGDLFTTMTAPEQKIYALIVERGEKDIDTLAYESKSTPGELASILLTLEFKGAIRSLPGKKFAAIC